MSLFGLALRNLIYRPWTTALSLILAALGAGLISLILLLSWQLEQQFDRNLAGIDLVVGAKGSPLQLMMSSMYHISSPTGNVPLAGVKPFLNPEHPYIELAVPLSLGDSYRGRRIVGTRPQFLELYGAGVATGELWSAPLDVVAGATAARELGLRVGDTFQSSHGLVEDDDLTHRDAAPFTVTGILAPTGTVADLVLLTPTESLWAVHDTHEHAEEGEGADHDHGEESEYDVTAPLTAYDDESITSVMLKFKGTSVVGLNMQRSINENTEMQAVTPSIQLTELYSTVGQGEEVLRQLGYVVVVVSILSIFIGLYSSLDRRRGELALLRTLGAGPGKLFGLLLLEGTITAVVGAMLGLLASHLGLLLVARYFSRAYRYDFQSFIFLPGEVYLLIGAVVVGALAATIPALRAARTDVHRTLSG
ncbi:putative ABC transport system permease protein [Neolewinella xylanilytica]|uniref:Putative ABC transport system permease protein n=1 Tax=Neolewinella xylanilytica TaxID=1514080 RepID=A0A2S6I1W1_9BACT|nr:FtsX-like permease family protein [Neolewinella xylanilytica]PPK85158.1 putative ABC transport system permease protein [Neolewinella xylanilytica]